MYVIYWMILDVEDDFFEDAFETPGIPQIMGWKMIHMVGNYYEIVWQPTVQGTSRYNHSTTSPQPLETLDLKKYASWHPGHEPLP